MYVRIYVCMYVCMYVRWLIKDTYILYIIEKTCNVCMYVYVCMMVDRRYIHYIEDL